MFPTFFNLTQIGCRMFRPTKANVSHSNLSTMVTYQHRNFTSSSTYLQSIGGSQEPGKPCRSSPVAPGPATLED
jgi:hypothetical protein